MQTLRHIVVGTDFSEEAEQALMTAVGFASTIAARITLVHVCELDADDHDDRRLVQCSEALSELVDRHRQAGLDISGVLRCGKPWTKLDNVAAEIGASAIVIGRHGAGGDRGIDLGSVAHQLVRTASRPVLMVPNDFNRLPRRDA